MSTRLSKKKIVEYLTKQSLELEKLNHFDTRDDYHQVRGKGEEKNFAYGIWITYLSLIQLIKKGYI